MADTHENEEREKDIVSTLMDFSKTLHEKAMQINESGTARG